MLFFRHTIFFIHSFVDGRLGSFQGPLAIINNAAMSAGVQIPLQDPSFNFFVYTASLGIHGALVPGHPPSRCFPWRLYHFIFPNNSVQGIHFLLILTNTCYFLFFVCLLVL